MRGALVTLTQINVNRIQWISCIDLFHNGEKFKKILTPVGLIDINTKE